MRAGGGLFLYRGRADPIDGLSQGNALQTQRYQFSGFLALSPTSLVTLQYGGELSIANSHREAHRLLLRYTTPF